MSLVEGSGNFECTQEGPGCDKNAFKTTNLKEFNKHQQTEGHIFVNGYIECSTCGASYHFDVLYAGTKPVCEKCNPAPAPTKGKGKK